MKTFRELEASFQLQVLLCVTEKAEDGQTLTKIRVKTTHYRILYYSNYQNNNNFTVH